jgi:hypothetical protein
MLDLKINVNAMIDWSTVTVNEAIQILSEVTKGSSSLGLGAGAGGLTAFDRANVRGVWKVLIDAVDAVALKVEECGTPREYHITSSY